MKVKIFDESHEKDLEEEINKFINENEIEIIDIKYSVSISLFSEEQKEMRCKRLAKQNK